MFLLDDDFIARRNVVAVQLLLRVNHLLWAGQLAVVLIHVEKIHLARWKSKQLFEAEFEISHVSRRITNFNSLNLSNASSAIYL